MRAPMCGDHARSAAPILRPFSPGNWDLYFQMAGDTPFPPSSATPSEGHPADASRIPLPRGASATDFRGER
ncbi:MAG: hypothetical protein LC798_21805 [Chloroflexi bacterium]|nr:hypothetical protein [Chloroflexota bacterium]